MTDSVREELRSYGHNIPPSDDTCRQPAIIGEFNTVRGRILALARALGRLAAREDAAEEEKAERPDNRCGGAIDALDEVPGPDTPNLDSKLSERRLG